MINKIKNSRGTTLIEMLIVIAIIGVVSTLVGSFFTTSEVVFREGQEQTVEQHAVRLAAGIISKRVRNANVIGLYDSRADAEVDGYDEYFYIKDEQLVLYDGSDEMIRTQADLDSTAGLDFTLSGGGNVYFLEFTIVGSDTFEVSSKVLLNNIDNDSGVVTVTNKAVVGFSKP